MTKAEKIQDLENRAYNLKAIFVCLALNGDGGNPNRDKALADAKKGYEQVCKELELLNA